MNYLFAFSGRIFMRSRSQIYFDLRILFNILFLCIREHILYIFLILLYIYFILYIILSYIIFSFKKFLWGKNDFVEVFIFKNLYTRKKRFY